MSVIKLQQCQSIFQENINYTATVMCFVAKHINFTILYKDLQKA